MNSIRDGAPVDIAVVEDVRVMVSRVEADQAEYKAAYQYHYQPQFQRDKNLGREKAHRAGQQERHNVAKFEDTVLQYRVVSGN